MKPSVITRLRDIVPIRPLTRIEAHSIAERQAQRFLKLLRLSEPPVPEELLCGLPRLEVVRRSPWPTSGATHWVNGRWVVIINGSEPRVRQKFSLAHEIKHIVDHRFIHVMYHGVPDEERQQFIESTCDYFAGCLLMPRPWVKRSWTTQTQRLDQLASRFGVSQAAMATRLNQIGLTGPTPRCARPSSETVLRAITNADAWQRYHRQADPAFALAGEVAA